MLIMKCTNAVKIFGCDIMINLLFQTFHLIFLRLYHIHVYIDYKRKLLIGHAKRASCSSKVELSVFGTGPPRSAPLPIFTGRDDSTRTPCRSTGESDGANSEFRNGSIRQIFFIFKYFLF